MNASTSLLSYDEYLALDPEVKSHYDTLNDAAEKLQRCRKQQSRQTQKSIVDSETSWLKVAGYGVTHARQGNYYEIYRLGH